MDDVDWSDPGSVRAHKRVETYEQEAKEAKRKEKARAYSEKYKKDPEIRARRRAYAREYLKRPEVKAHMKKYYARPEVKARLKEYHTKYYSRPEVKERRRKRMREYQRRPYVKAKLDKYYKTYYATKITLDDLVGLLHKNKCMLAKNKLPPLSASAITAGKKIGVIREVQDVIVLVDSPMLAAIDGFYVEAQKKYIK
jgi:hypothetical protein